MKKILLTSFFVFLVVGLLAVVQPAFAEENDNDVENDTVLIQSLLEQIEALTLQLKALQEQVEALQKEQTEVKKEIHEVLGIARQLEEGMTGDDIKLLQEMLATDPEIYPEGLITGFFGPLTKRAVMKFQEKFGIEQAGRVGPKTLSRINQILEEGVGETGKVPPGLLLAPGIQKKIDSDFEFIPPGLGGVPPGQAKKDQDEEAADPEKDENGNDVNDENGKEEDNGEDANDENGNDDEDEDEEDEDNDENGNDEDEEENDEEENEDNDE